MNHKISYTLNPKILGLSVILMLGLTACPQTPVPVKPVVTNVLPKANFTLSVSSGKAPLSVQADASSSSDPDGTIASYAWDFGDGSSSTEKSVVHVYSKAGTYTLKLTVTDNLGAVHSKTAQVVVTDGVVVNQLPIALFTVTPTAGTLTVAFDASGSSDPDGTLVDYAWDFGDQTKATGKTASHTFEQEGTFKVTLTVKDNVGATASKTTDVVVSKTVVVVPPVDATAPKIVSVSPTLNQKGVSSDAKIVITFDEPMNKTATQAAFQSADLGTVGFAWNTDATVLTITPNVSLVYLTGDTAKSYAFSLGIGATDVAGNPIVPSSYSFSTLRHVVVSLKSMASIDGMAVGDNTVQRSSFTAQVGDDEKDVVKKMLISFDLSSLPNTIKASDLENADLSLFLTAKAGSSFATTVSHVTYGDTLNPSAFGLTPLRVLGGTVGLQSSSIGQYLSLSSEIGKPTVLDALKDDLINANARGNRSQFRLEPDFVSTKSLKLSVDFGGGQSGGSGNKSSDVKTYSAGEQTDQAPTLKFTYLAP